MWYAIDIETYPNSEAEAYLPAVKAKATLKDPEKIAEDIKEKREVQRSKMALNPLFGKVACIGIHGEDLSGCFIDEDERALLIKFYKWFKDKETKISKRFVSYNGKSFDFPFVFKRMAVLGIAPLSELKGYINKYSNDLHIDIMTEWCNFGEYEKLDTLARVLLDDCKDPFDVTVIKDLIKTPEGRKQLQEYCLQDCYITFKLAKKLGYIA